jgi:hypothetical protein
MSERLESLSKIPGVTGVAIATKNGDVIESKLQAPFDPILVRQVIDELRTASQALRYVDDADPNLFVMFFGDGMVSVRFTEHYAIIAFGKGNVNMSMINVGFNVVAAKAQQLGAPPAAMGSGPRAVAAASRNSQMPGGLSQSGGDSQGGTAPADAVDSAVTTNLIKELARYMGPIAKVVVKQELSKLGLSARTLGASNMDQLIQNVAQRIDETVKRDDFIRAAKAISRR